MSSTTLGPPLRPLVAMGRDHARAYPGQAERIDLAVRNPGNVVETYVLRVLGPAAAWADVVPDRVSLFPGEEAVATLTVRPPMTPRVVAGEYVVGLQAVSEVHRDSATTAEVVVTVEPFSRFRAESASMSSVMRRRCTVLVYVVNEGNSTVTYAATALDPEGFLTTNVIEPTFTLAPGESRWVNVVVSAGPKLIGSSFDTRSVTITVTPTRDVDADLPVVDPEPQSVYATVLHKPFIRIRLGAFGRLILLLTLLGLLAAFLVTRYISSTRPAATGAPPVPAAFSAQTDASNRVVLTWEPSSGADSFLIYAVGPVAGDPAPSPTPTVIVEQPTVTSPAGGVGAVSVVPAGLVPAAQPAPTPTREPTDAELAGPVCLGCSEIATVDGGTTRYVVPEVNPGDACYRIVAQVGQMRSLFSNIACTPVAEQTLVDLDGDGNPDGVGAPVPPCAPERLRAKPYTRGSVVLLWGEGSPPRSTRLGGMKADALAPQGMPLDGGAGGAGGGTVTGGDALGCDPEAEVTGYVLQQQLLTGWADVSPPPKAGDTAFEVEGLLPANLACFRLKALAATGESAFSRTRCSIPGTMDGGGAADVPSGTTPDPAAVDAARSTGGAAGSGSSSSSSSSSSDAAPQNPADSGPWGPITSGSVSDAAPPALR